MKQLLLAGRVAGLGFLGRVVFAGGFAGVFAGGVVGVFWGGISSASAAGTSPGSQPGAQEIRPPFGFQWGENPERLTKLLEQAKARVEGEELIHGRLRLEVTGISQRMLLRSFFYFDQGSLSEIELHYGNAGWDSRQYTDFFDQTRRFLDQKYGQGRLLARTKTEQGGINSSLMGYQWNQPGASLQLFLFIAEKGGESLRVLSLHYRG